MRASVAACLAFAAALSAHGTRAGALQDPRGDASRDRSGAVRYLKASNPGEDDKLGAGDPLVGVTLAISADGSTLAVSAPREDSAARGINGNQRDESAWDAGAVYVFVRVGNSWTQQAY